MTTQVLGQVRSVSDQTAGSELSADAAIGQTLTVEDLEWVSESGGSLLVGTDARTYDAVSFVANTVHLTVATSQIWPTGTRVEPNPTSINRYMEVWTESEDYEDDPEALTARVPNVFRDRMPIGTREADAGEYVIVQREGDVEGEWVFIDFPGESLAVDLSGAIDPDSPPISDGVPPTTSPAASVVGAIGAIVVTWPAVANHDSIEYEVHISTSPAFVPTPGDAATLAATQAGAGPAWIRKLPNGNPLEYGTLYYVRLISRDQDGTASAGAVASATPVQATTGDIAVDAITADQILARSITAQKLLSEFVLANTFYGGDPLNQHVEMDANGIRLLAADGTPMVDLPTDPAKDAVFSGEVIARAITVIEAATIRGTLTLDRGASMRFSSSIVDPVSQPTVSVTRDSMDYLKHSTSYNLIKRQGFWYDASGSGSQPTVFYTDQYFFGGLYLNYIVEAKQSDGTVVRSKLMGSGTNATFLGTVNGVVRVGSIVYVLSRDTVGTYISRWNQSDLSAAGGNVTVSSHLGDEEFPSLAYDGTNLLVIDSDNGGFDTLVLKYTAANPPAYVSTTTISGMDWGNGGMAVAESKWWFGGNVYGSSQTAGEDMIKRTSTAGVRGTSDDDFEAVAGTGDCIGHDGSVFIVGSRTSTKVYKHTNWTWTPSQSSKLWVAYSWYDQNATGGTHETAVGPRASLTMAKRAKLAISTPSIPGAGGTDDPNRVRIYANWGTSEPTGGSPTRFAGFLQVEDALTTRTVSTIDLTGSPPENIGANSFSAGGNESSLQSDTGVPLLRSNGIPRVKVKNGGGVSVTDNNATVIPPASEDADTDGFWDGSANYIIIPYAGQYEVLCQLSFAVSNSNRRTCTLQSAPSPYTTWSDLGADFFAAAAAVGTDRTTCLVAAMLDQVAGQGIRVRAYQNSGGTLNTTMRLTLLFAGPT